VRYFIQSDSFSSDSVGRNLGADPDVASQPPTPITGALTGGGEPGGSFRSRTTLTPRCWRHGRTRTRTRARARALRGGLNEGSSLQL